MCVHVSCMWECDCHHEAAILILPEFSARFKMDRFTRLFSMYYIERRFIRTVCCLFTASHLACHHV